MDDELIKKIAISGLAIFSFLAVTFIFYSQNNRLEEVSLQEITSSEDVALNEKSSKSLKDLSGSKYACDDEKFVFVDIYAENGGYKANVAVANSDGQYAMAYLTEIIGVGEEKKFVDEYKNSLILTDSEAQVYINDILVVKNCVKR